MKIVIVLSVAALLLSIGSVSAQKSWPRLHGGAGINGGSLNAPTSVSSALSYTLSWNLLEMKNASFSIATHLKVGAQDKTQTGLGIIADLFADGNGPDENWFVETPLLLRFNFGKGSTDYTTKPLGFYLGAGINYVVTTFTNAAGNYQGTEFFGLTADGGLRFRKGLDINLAITNSIRRPIGQISQPVTYELALLAYF